MKASIFARGALLLAFACAGCGETAGTPEGAKQHGDRKVLFYRSPMDPTFISDKPGKDGMGMDLVPVHEGDPEADLSSIKLRGALVQQMGIRVAEVRRGRPTRMVRALGQVEFDETRVSHVNMKFDGWIEKLWVDETGQFVKRGDPLFAVYSPELVASQEEYLQTLRLAPGGGPHSQHIISASRRRLLQFDVPKGFVNEIRREKKARRTVIIRAPSSGYVLHKQAFPGTHVKTGANLFTLADLDALWVMADVYEFDAPWVTVGQEATVELDYLPGRVEKAKVDFVYPVLDEMARTIKVRLSLPNPGVVLKPGMFATVRIHTHPSGEVVLVPSEAVLLSGERARAFVALPDGRFEPRTLELGVRGDQDYAVLSGLEAGEHVVVSGQFLLDSESRLKEAVLKMLGSNLPGAISGQHAGHDMKGTEKTPAMAMDAGMVMPADAGAGMRRPQTAPRGHARSQPAARPRGEAPARPRAPSTDAPPAKSAAPAVTPATPRGQHGPGHAPPDH